VNRQIFYCVSHNKNDLPNSRICGTFHAGSGLVFEDGLWLSRTKNITGIAVNYDGALSKRKKICNLFFYCAKLGY
jgi:hypothetical protein